MKLSAFLILALTGMDQIFYSLFLITDNDIFLLKVKLARIISLITFLVITCKQFKT